MKLKRIVGMGVLLWSCMLLLGGYTTSSLTITTSGTPVRLSSATPVPPTSCISLTVQVLSTNSGVVFLGGSNVSAANKIGLSMTNGLTPPASVYFSPSSTTALYSPENYWLDSTVSGDKVVVACSK